MPLDANGKYVVLTEVFYPKPITVTVPEVPRHLRYDNNPAYPLNSDLGKSLEIIQEEGNK